MADDYPFGYLDQVGKMCADVQHVVDLAVFCLVLQQFNPDDFADPGSGSLQIIKENVIGYFLPVE